MRIGFLSLLLCLLIDFLPAQGVQWAFETWGDVHGNFDVDVSGEIAIAGYDQQPPLFHGIDLSCGSFSGIPILARYHPDGSLVWARCFEAGNYSQAKHVLLGPGGTVYVLGYFYDSLAIDGSSRISHGLTDLFICKFSSSGQLLWMEQIGGSLGEFPQGMILNHLGGVTITGSTFFPTQFGGQTVSAPGHNPSWPGNFVAQFDNQGNLRWVSTGQTHAFGHELKSDGQGNTYLIGNYSDMFYWENDSMPANNGDSFVLQLDSTGQVQWLRRISTGHDDDAAYAAGRPGGGLYFLLRTGANVPGSAIWYGPSNSLQPQIIPDSVRGIQLVHLDSNGDWQWHRDLHPQVDSLDWGEMALALDASDSLHMFVLEGVPLGNTLKPFGLRQLQIAQDGHVRGSAHADSVNALQHVRFDGAQNIYLYGGFRLDLRLGTFLLSSINGNHAAYLARMEQLVGVPQPATPAMQVRAFPNPSSGLVDIDLGDGASGTWQLRDLHGRILQAGTCTGGRGQLTLAHLAQGLYLLHVQAHGQVTVLRVVRD